MFVLFVHFIEFEIFILYSQYNLTVKLMKETRFSSFYSGIYDLTTLRLYDQENKKNNLENFDIIFVTVSAIQ